MALTGTEKQRRYVERHPERRAAYLASPHFKALAAAKTARYRLRHPEKITEYREKNADRIKSANAIYRARVGVHPMNQSGSDAYKKYRSSERFAKIAVEGHLRRSYGITLAEYERIYQSQNGKCKICGGTTSNRKWKDGRIQRLKLFVDHDHESGKIRGLLCSTCNRGIAFLKEDISVLEAAIKYLMESRQ